MTPGLLLHWNYTEIYHFCKSVHYLFVYKYINCLTSIYPWWMRNIILTKLNHFLFPFRWSSRCSSWLDWAQSVQAMCSRHIFLPAGKVSWAIYIFLHCLWHSVDFPKIIMAMHAVQYLFETTHIWNTRTCTPVHFPGAAGNYFGYAWEDKWWICIESFVFRVIKKFLTSKLLTGVNKSKNVVLYTFFMSIWVFSSNV